MPLASRLSGPPSFAHSRPPRQPARFSPSRCRPPLPPGLMMALRYKRPKQAIRSAGRTAKKRKPELCEGTRIDSPPQPPFRLPLHLVQPSCQGFHCWLGHCLFPFFQARRSRLTNHLCLDRSFSSTSFGLSTSICHFFISPFRAKMPPSSVRKTLTLFLIA